MKTLPNFNFGSQKSFNDMVVELCVNINLLAEYVLECDPLTEVDRETLIVNIQWLKRFYEALEREILDDNRV
jgi:hypothetical protein